MSYVVTKYLGRFLGLVCLTKVQTMLPVHGERGTLQKPSILAHNIGDIKFFC